MNIIKKLIGNADAESRYPIPGEMDQIKDFVSSGDRRLRLVKALNESWERIVKKTIQSFHIYTWLARPGIGEISCCCEGGE
ncbi:MAG: hypothetical protein OHK0047_44100 [Leptolyngbyaceae cyanobacterium]